MSTSTLNIVMEAFGNHISNLAVSLYKQLLPLPPQTRSEKWDISLLYMVLGGHYNHVEKVISRQKLCEHGACS